MKRDLLKLSNVTVGNTDNIDTGIIPTGNKLIITRFGAADVNIGDNKSSLFILKWGVVGSFDELAVISLCGDTFEYAMKEQLIGDGVKFLRISRSHQSASDKRCPVWVKAYDVA